MSFNNQYISTHLYLNLWWYLFPNFFPLQPNQEDQDQLFDRIAGFVAHFLLVPKDAEDTFFQVIVRLAFSVMYGLDSAHKSIMIPKRKYCILKVIPRLWSSPIIALLRWLCSVVALLAVEVFNYCRISQQGYNHTQRHNL